MANTIYGGFFIKWSDNSIFDTNVNANISSETNFMNPFRPDQFIGTLFPSPPKHPIYVQKVYITCFATTKKYFTEWGFKKSRNDEFIQNHIVIELTSSPGDNSNTMGFTPLNRKGFVEINTQVNINVAGINEDQIILRKNKQLVSTIAHELFHAIQMEYAQPVFSEHALALIEGTAVLITDFLVGNNLSNASLSLISALKELFPNNENNGKRNFSNPLYLERASAPFWKYLFNNKNSNSTSNDIAINIRTLFEEISNNGYELAPFCRALRHASAKTAWFGNLDQFSYFDRHSTNAAIKEASFPYYMLNSFINIESMESPLPVVINSVMNDERLKKITNSFGLEEINMNSSNIMEPYSFKVLRIFGETKINIISSHTVFCSFLYISNPPESPSKYDIKNIEIHQVKNIIKSITNRRDLTYLLIGTGKETSRVTITQEPLQELYADVQITRWNSKKAKDFEINPLGFSWVWASPDIQVGSNRGSKIVFNEDNSLKIRLRNNGNTRAKNIAVEYYFQEASPYLSEDKWLPLVDKNGRIQKTLNETLEVDEEKWIRSVYFCPKKLQEKSSQKPEHFAFKVVVKVPNDVNPYNKIAIHNLIRIPESNVGKNINTLINYSSFYNIGKLRIVQHGKNFGAKASSVPRILNTNVNRSYLDYEHQMLLYPNAHLKKRITIVKTNLLPLKKWENENLAFDKPAGFYFPLPENDSYPENVNPNNLITIYHMIDGRLVGGMSIEITK